jgi:hypothetical protein
MKEQLETLVEERRNYVQSGIVVHGGRNKMRDVKWCQCIICYNRHHSSQLPPRIVIATNTQLF